MTHAVSMEQQFELAAQHVATRGLEAAAQRVLENLTVEQRMKLAGLGLVGEELMLQLVHNIDVVSISADVASRALAHVEDGTGDEVDPLNAVIVLETTEHPFVPQVQAYLEERLSRAA